MQNPKGTVILLSGGLDSTTLLARAVHIYGVANVKAISFDYGQRHVRELEAARAVAQYYGVDHRTATLDLDFRNNALTGMKAVPEGHYADESMKVTVVPNRNMIMMSIAAGMAIDCGFGRIGIANHFGDHAIYPDCRSVFIDKVSVALFYCHYEPITLWAPFTMSTKREIAIEAADRSIPVKLTWSCYKGGNLHCGKCGTCVERIEALEGFDPTEYETPYALGD